MFLGCYFSGLFLIDFVIMEGFDSGFVGGSYGLIVVHGMRNADRMGRLIRRIQMIGRLFILMWVFPRLWGGLIC